MSKEVEFVAVLAYAVINIIMGLLGSYQFFLDPTSPFMSVILVVWLPFLVLPYLLMRKIERISKSKDAGNEGNPGE